LRLFWFATPIFYTLNSTSLQFLINPLAHFIQIFRDVIIYNQMPSTMILLSVIISPIISLSIGIFVFNKFKNTDAVGGRLKAISKDKRIVSKSITFVTDSVFGSGGKRYRTRIKGGFVKDTLPSCAYRRKVFDKIGYFDEKFFISCEDVDFCFSSYEGRIKK